MKRIDDGGPAVVEMELTYNGGYPNFHITQGMSLRDWFAGQALAGKMEIPYEDKKPVLKKIAVACYAMADAMLNQREADGAVE